ncbi:polymer-forming cytoskeletal protein [Gymnodinialimonas hymeniacidonis]|uniref:bactofilin family protein n=1 Tax=Gymnodinialimonas hymeniacidonis TaxID=3126508 RepID=UPI0034C6D0F7
MFSKSKINEPGPKQGGASDGSDGDSPAAGTTSGDTMNKSTSAASGSKSKPQPSMLSSDLTIVGNLRTTGDIQVEGTVQGDIRAHLLTVGESANIEGEIVADDIVVTGRVVGRVRGLKVRLTSTARVEGDIIHKTIAIESGAHFEGSVQRAEDPLSTGANNAAPRTPITTGGSASSAPEAPAAPSIPRPAAAGPAPQPSSSKSDS